MARGSLGFEALRPIPVQTGLTFQQVVVGESHSCGLTADSTAWCWGRNWEGQLGAGDSVSSTAPRGVVGGLHFASLTLGNVTSCGLTAAGMAYCWGGGRSDVPSLEQPGTVFLTLTAGLGDRVCGVRADSTIACRYVYPYAASAHRPLPFPSAPRPPRRRVRGSM
jgi:hypothetical protein